MITHAPPPTAPTTPPATRLDAAGPSAFDNMRFWDAGALGGRSLDVVAAIAPFITIGIVLCIVVGRSLNVTVLGDDLAKSIGGNVDCTQALSLVAVTLLAGAATAGAARSASWA